MKRVISSLAILFQLILLVGCDAYPDNQGYPQFLNIDAEGGTIVLQGISNGGINISDNRNNMNQSTINQDGYYCWKNDWLKIRYDWNDSKMLITATPNNSGTERVIDLYFLKFSNWYIPGGITIRQKSK